ncbi:hypothetical protein B0T21DRAFT_408979 [Apiosordaria backusii]|uniref:Uncharacterized protein n=1 Tax=Apiosordaria backusii TaxID=314023 RepID=A0AA40K195_9PEZI|nr:hypothetical protein B0T21DRAFT_408979 [Apiosordaria backusii]
MIEVKKIKMWSSAAASHYAHPGVSERWAALLEAHQFGVWARDVAGQNELERHGERWLFSQWKLEHRYDKIPQFSVPAQNSRRVVIPAALVENVRFMGHLFGDHVFRLAKNPRTRQSFKMCLQYEGQVRRPYRHYFHRFRDTVLPAILEMVISLLAFEPASTVTAQQQALPSELQRIRSKLRLNEIKPIDIEILIEAWNLRFVGFRDETTKITPRIRPAKLLPAAGTLTAMITYAEAAWLIYKLRQNDRWGYGTYRLEWNSIIPLLEAASDLRFVDLLKHHTDRMKCEGLAMLFDKDPLVNAHVLVYCRPENVTFDCSTVSGSDSEVVSDNDRKAQEWEWVPTKPDFWAAGNDFSQSTIETQLLYRDPQEHSTFHRFYHNHPATWSPRRGQLSPLVNDNCQAVGSPKGKQFSTGEAPNKKRSIDSTETAEDFPPRKKPRVASEPPRDLPTGRTVEEEPADFKRDRLTPAKPNPKKSLPQPPPERAPSPPPPIRKGVAIPKNGPPKKSVLEQRSRHHNRNPSAARFFFN